MLLWNPDHPEADAPALRALAWQQAAELATVAPERAAVLLTLYETSPDADAAARVALELEGTRADYLRALRINVSALRDVAELKGGQA